MWHYLYEVQPARNEIKFPIMFVLPPLQSSCNLNEIAWYSESPKNLLTCRRTFAKRFFITRREKEVCLQWGVKSNLWRNIFRPNVKCRQTQSKIVIGTRDLVNYGGVLETSIIKTVRGRGLCVLQQRFAMLLSLALLLASVFCSLFCWTISMRQGKELVSRNNNFFFC